jgi:hypothetical protein
VGEGPKNFVGMIEFIAVSSGQAKKAVLFLSFYFRNKPSPLLLGGALWNARDARGDHIANGIVSANRITL